ncbi:glycosyltransferase involved in cell wall biosynthesis [Christiangramia gaetbulicola]|uniref:Glycosyltransferase involved in cell wall biosynthesis n=1 Tax=Christiangramia gaetbulicola TaxID=703340 RepID=A0A2T6AFN9_9FLAO|nr:glycosyltransferase [Christiangramia gaetbulicola]PTX42621.1 glycosyltransferase involved in cell wall biosynthesis [Christiangramia gaetbulicola]
MKILIVIDSLGSGGAERSTAVLSDYLYEKEINFDVICLDQKTVGVQSQMQAKGYKIYFFEKNNFFSQVKYLAKFIKKGEYDLVHSILFRANIRTRFAKLFQNFVHLESLVNTTYSKERFNDKRVNQKALWFYKNLDKNSASWGVDHFHSITETVKEHYIKEVNIKPEIISVIPRGRKPLLNEYEQKPATSSEMVSFINVGRHEFQKGQIYLLKAVKILKDKGYLLNLTILGRDGTMTPEMKNYINENSLAEIVSIEGFKENVPDYLLKSDVFVFPSLFEGLGGALIEAQAAGLPIACNNIPVLHEVVKDNKNAKFFDVHKIDSMVETLIFFIENPKERVAYGKESLKNYKLRFQEKKNNQKMLDLFKGLC